MPVFILFLLILFSFISYAFADTSYYVFVIDENSKPIVGYKILPTTREDVFISKSEPIKKWIVQPKSTLIVVKNRDFYPVKDTFIFDRKKGIVLLLIDPMQKKTSLFEPERLEIDSNIKVLLDSRKDVLAKIETVFPISKTPSFEAKIPITPQRDLLSLAEQYDKTGQLDKALPIYEQLINIYPENREFIEKAGTIHYKLGNFSKAKEYFSSLPKDEKTLTKLAGIYMIEKNFEKALRLIDTSTFSKSAYMHYLRGVLLYLLNRKDEAYKELSILMKLDKSLAQSLRDLLR